MLKRHIIIYGRVQGVGFRNFTQIEAQKLGINGWVKNNTDGTVELKAEGDEKAVTQFLDSLAKGNQFSKVENADIKTTDIVEHNGTFEVRY